jgi:hypothetical protein
LTLEVYYESIKREPKIRGINKCLCDERLQTKTLWVYVFIIMGRTKKAEGDPHFFKLFFLKLNAPFRSFPKQAEAHRLQCHQGEVTFLRNDEKDGGEGHQDCLPVERPAGSRKIDFGTGPLAFVFDLP